MKIFRYIAAALAAAAMLACTGTVDDSSLPVLEVSDVEIDLATETQAVFTVTYDGVDVTAEAQIYSSLGSQALAGNIYIYLKMKVLRSSMRCMAARNLTA